MVSMCPHGIFHFLCANPYRTLFTYWQIGSFSTLLKQTGLLFPIQSLLYQDYTSIAFAMSLCIVSHQSKQSIFLYLTDFELFNVLLQITNFVLSISFYSFFTMIMYYLSCNYLRLVLYILYKKKTETIIKAILQY